MSLADPPAPPTRVLRCISAPVAAASVMPSTRSLAPFGIASAPWRTTDGPLSPPTPGTPFSGMDGFMDSDDEAEMTPTSKVAASRPQTGPEGTPGTPGSPGPTAPPIPLLMQPVAQRFQLEAFAKAAGKRGLLGRKRADGSVTLPVMAAHQAVDLPLSLLKLSSENTNRAVKNFAMILKYCEGKPLPPADAAALCQPMLKAAVKRPELRDELFLHLVKQSRGNPSEDSLARVWVLMSLLCCTAPPSRELAPFVSAFVQQSVNDPAAPPAVQAAASVAFEGLRNTVKHGARRTTPSQEQIVAHVAARKLNTISFFLDETFEELPYGLCTTIAEASKFVASVISLENFATFTLFEARKVSAKEIKDGAAPEEHVSLAEGRYLADVLHEIRARAAKNDSAMSRLVFKKKLFRDADEGITEPVFISLSYVQAQHDYLNGQYPVTREDACQLAALMMLADMGAIHTELESAEQLPLERYIPRLVMGTRPRVEWEQDVVGRMRTLEQFTNEDARVQMLRLLRALPYGQSTFFTCKRIEDPIGLLPGKLILGINRRGVHFFRPVPKEYLHTAELRDIMQFGSSASAVFFKMRVAGQLHIFQFETKQGEEICLALQTHINDVMMKRYAKRKEAAQAARKDGDGAADAGAAAQQGGATEVGAPAGMAPFNKQAAEVSKRLDEERTRADRLQSEAEAAASKEAQAVAKAADAEDRLNVQESRAADLAAQLEEAQAELQRLRVEGVPSSSGGDGGAASAEALAALEEAKKEARQAASEAKAASEEAALAEKRAARLEAQLADTESGASASVAAAREEAATKLAERDAKIESLAGELQEALDARARVESELEAANESQAELDELREMKADIERKEKQHAEIISRQGAQLNELEALYKEEQVLRKRYFNQMEDMKGKIRVYCRTRPLSGSEEERGDKVELTSPDEFTIEHPWGKEGKEKKTFQFDHYFPGDATQEQVFEDTKYLVQSAVDGYNVCIFAYGQTGSGKTHTIQGSPSMPGLQPRAVDELFDIIDRDSGKYSFDLQCYMLELYQENLVDLHAVATKSESAKLAIKKDIKGMVYVDGAMMLPVTTRGELTDVVTRGLKGRRVGATKMNADSSRSHLVLSVVITATNLQTQHTTKGKLTFCDLAGSERVKKSGSTGEQLKEAQAINKSLSALGDVISALSSEAKFVPYRNHKLSMLLSDSLGGNAKTLMFVNVSPATYNLDETHNSLQYASRVRTIVNNASKDEANKHVQKLKQAVTYWKAQAGKPAQPGEPEGGLYDVAEERE